MTIINRTEPMPLTAFGVDWELNVTDHPLRGEVEWISLEFNWDGCVYFVIHNDETGGFQVVEYGGTYLNPYDKALGDFDSPLAAMQFAAKHLRASIEDGKRFEATMYLDL